MGLAYHLWYFAAINPAAYLFGAAFVVQGLLFAGTGALEGRLSFGFRPDAFGLAGLALVTYAGVIYAVLGYLSGHGYPRAPVFGVAPCPTTIFTLGLLLLTDRPVPRHLLVVPVLWSLVGGSAAVLLAVPEDLGLLVAGLVGGVLIIAKDTFRREAQREMPA